MVVAYVLVLDNFNLVYSTFIKLNKSFKLKSYLIVILKDVLNHRSWKRLWTQASGHTQFSSSGVEVGKPTATMEHPPTPLSKLVSDWGWLSTVDSAEPEHGFANGLDSSPRWPWSRWHTRSWDLSPRGAAGEQTWRKEELVQEVTATPRPRIHSWQGRCHCEVALLRPTYW